MELTLKLNRVITHYKRYLNYMRESGICFENSLVLYCLNKGINSLTKISNYTRKDPSYVKRLLDSMVEEELIYKERCRYHITEKGTESLDDLNLLNKEILSNEDDEFLETLLKIEKSLEVYFEDPIAVRE